MCTLNAGVSKERSEANRCNGPQNRDSDGLETETKSATIRAMKIRMQWAAVVIGTILVSGTGACKSNPAGKVPADVSIIKYKSPDISEITGIEAPEEPDGTDSEPDDATTPAPKATTPAPTPAPKATTPAPAPKATTPPKAK
jgi:hypothetical protein